MPTMYTQIIFVFKIKLLLQQYDVYIMMYGLEFATALVLYIYGFLLHQSQTHLQKIDEQFEFLLFSGFHKNAANFVCFDIILLHYL